MPHGEFWYAMSDENAVPFGYARLRLEPVEEGTRCDWELKLAFPGGTYEEERSAVHDAAGRTCRATWAADGEHVEVERRGSRLVGRRMSAAGEAAIDVDVEDDALAGLGFVLVAELPLTPGASHAFHDYNEAQGVVPEGQAVFEVVGPERLTIDGATHETWKVLLRRSDGREMPIWIDAERCIVQIDWGGGNLMTIAREPTAHLFRPQA